MENIDPNPENYVCAGVIQTKSQQIGCLLRLEPNAQAQVKHSASMDINLNNCYCFINSAKEGHVTARVSLLDGKITKKSEQILMKVSGNVNGPRKRILNFDVLDSGRTLIY